MPVFSEVLSKFLKCTAVGMSITTCNFFLIMPTVGMKAQTTVSKPLKWKDLIH